MIDLSLRVVRDGCYWPAKRAAPMPRKSYGIGEKTATVLR
jgi:hypothetical protein